MVESVAPELVAVLHGLDAVVRALQDAEGKLTLVVGGHQARSVAHLVAVDHERHTLHGDAGAVVLHVARELDARAHLHQHVLHHVLARFRAEGDVYPLHIAHSCGQRVVGLLLILIGQVLEAEEAALVGLGRTLLAIDGHDDGLAGYAGAVEETQAALHGTRLLAHALYLLGFVVVQALATGHTAYLIYILVDGRGLLVFILHVGQLRDKWLVAITALALFLAPHLVVVYGLFGLVGPCQHCRSG